MCGLRLVRHAYARNDNMVGLPHTPKQIFIMSFREATNVATLESSVAKIVYHIKSN